MKFQENMSYNFWAFGRAFYGPEVIEFFLYQGFHCIAFLPVNPNGHKTTKVMVSLVKIRRKGTFF